MVFSNTTLKRYPCVCELIDVSGYIFDDISEKYSDISSVVVKQVNLAFLVGLV